MMNELDMYYTRAELAYRQSRLRDAIAGRRQRHGLKPRRRRPMGSAVS